MEACIYPVASSVYNSVPQSQETFMLNNTGRGYRSPLQVNMSSITKTEGNCSK